MSKRLIAGLALFLLTAVLSNVNAQPREGRKSIGKEQRQQMHRIHRGVRNGSLTHREAAALHMQQAQIQHDKEIMKLDGRISRKERAYLKMEQAHANQNIYMQTHDGQCRR
ncbi:MAG: hypothetical protein U0V74_14195 [Chitinophagales bacterium]